LKDTPKWQAIQAQSNSQSMVAAPSSDMPSSTPAVVIDADEDNPENG
jgi:hypothetical protein